MKRAKRWLLITAALLVLVTQAASVAPFKKVSVASTTKATNSAASATTATTTTATTTTTTTEAPQSAVAAEAKPDNDTATAHAKNSKLTGIPQIDYIWDPNLPRELRGYNLSSYPFFSTVPPEEDIHFKCDGLHDGFYASIEYKCQVYHHCVYGIRHDFLCANFTAFDQRTFICHFVSDVDCEGSEKYWNRNDDLYMATTTTSTTTTTTEPPPTPRRRPAVRPLRPLRRPLNRRPIDDYYYQEEEEGDYEDDYYEERLNRRRKQRPRHRKPLVDYEDEYEERRSFSDDEKPRRNRFREEDDPEDDYDSDRRKYDRPKTRTKPAVVAERRKTASRKPGTVLAHSNADERRSFSDDRPYNGRKDKRRPQPTPEDSVEPIDTQPRRLAGKRRINEKRTSSSPSTAAADFDDLDDYEKLHATDQEEAAEEAASHKGKTTPKSVEEFITPKAAPASVYARPRAPPRIAPPVPIAEKKKYQYPVQKTATTASPDVAQSEDEDYYGDEDYAEERVPHGHLRRRIVDNTASKLEDDVLPVSRKRNHNESPLGRKPTLTSLRKPVTDKKPLPATAEDEDYDVTGSASSERYDSRSNARRHPYTGRTRGPVVTPLVRGADDVDFVDDDYDERPVRPIHRLRPKSSARKGAKKPRLPVAVEAEEGEDSYEPQPERPTFRSRAGQRKTVSNGRLRHPPAHRDVDVASDAEDDNVEVPATSSKTLPTSPSGRPASVRVVKRPFLPSRGGSPYLPRGLQPVGIALKPFGGTGIQTHTTDSTPLDMGSTISGVRLLEHGAPILRDSGAIDERQPLVPLVGPRTTLPPRSAIPVSAMRPEPSQPKLNLDELYENDYDVTLNDALNPTLKPLSPHPSNNHHHHHNNRNYPTAFASVSLPPGINTFVNNNQSPAIHNNNNNNNNYGQEYQKAYQSVPTHLSQSQSQAQHQHQSESQSESVSESESESQSQSHLQQHQQQLQQQQRQAIDNYNSDSYFSSTDIRRRAIVPASPARSSRTDYRGVGTRIAHHFFDDFEY